MTVYLNCYKYNCSTNIDKKTSKLIKFQGRGHKKSLNSEIVTKNLFRTLMKP